MGGTESSSQKTPEPGDLIEIPRKLYSHWAVSVGDGNVVHLTTSGSSSSSGAPRKDGVVKKERLSKIAGGGRYRINNQYDKKHSRRPREEIVEEAEKKVGKQVDYDLLKSNCEHFATRLGYGVADSEQADAAITALFGDQVARHVSESRKME